MLTVCDAPLFERITWHVQVFWTVVAWGQVKLHGVEVTPEPGMPVAVQPLPDAVGGAFGVQVFTLFVVAPVSLHPP